MTYSRYTARKMTNCYIIRSNSCHCIWIMKIIEFWLTSKIISNRSCSYILVDMIHSNTIIYRKVLFLTLTSNEKRVMILSTHVVRALPDIINEARARGVGYLQITYFCYNCETFVLQKCLTESLYSIYMKEK